MRTASTLHRYRWAGRSLGGRVLAIAVIVAFGVVAMAPGANASNVQPDKPVICDNGATVLNFTKTNVSETVLHDMTVTNSAGNEIDTEKNVTETSSITASVSFTSSGTVEASAVMAKFSDTESLTLAASGSHTTTSSVTLTQKISAAGSFAVYDGEKKYTGTWSGYLCADLGTYEEPLAGTAQSYAVYNVGNVKCGSSQTSGSLAAKAEAIAC